MSDKVIKIPDIGGVEAEVIEICVKPGSHVELNESVIVLESDKATMEVPSPNAGEVVEILLNVGDKVGEGKPMIKLSTAYIDDINPEGVDAPATDPMTETHTVQKSTEKKIESEIVETSIRIESVRVPDIGADDVPVIEVCVKEGDSVEQEASLIVLESDKATMDIPSPVTGVVKAVHVKENEVLSQGNQIVDIEVTEANTVSTPSEQEPISEHVTRDASIKENSTQEHSRDKKDLIDTDHTNSKFHAGPAVRRMAREFGVDLSRVTGSGPHQRILKEDVQLYVKRHLSGQAVEGTDIPSSSGIPAVADIDFSKWGDIEEVELNRLRKVATKNFLRAWLNVPHVTQFDECDITELEAFRKAHKMMAETRGTKLTLLPFVLKAVAYVLKSLPQFCASLNSSGEVLIYKKYVNIGVAVDTPSGLLVPVIANVDKKGLWELAAECVDMAAKARDNNLKPGEMQGGCFTISSLGSVGGTAFTPIVNVPEVAILGISKSSIKPVWNGTDFVPKLMLPLSLSYDHRAINGADAARFTTLLGEVLTDIRKLLF